MSTTTSIIELQPPSATWSASMSSPFHHSRSEPFESTDSPTRRSTSIINGPINGMRVQQRWNDPPINKWRLTALFFAFIIFGANDGAYGTLLPAIGHYYDDLSYTVVSLIFLSPFLGYFLAALCSDALHVRFGQRGLALVSPSFRLVTYIVLSLHPPYGLVVAVLGLAGLGHGLMDAGWNAWISDMVHANQLLGILNGCYGLGATISPLVVGTIVNTYSLPWYTFYYIMAGFVALELVTTAGTFWKETGSEFRRKHAESGPERGRTKAALKRKVTWLCALLLLTYVGSEVSLGGWIVTYMMQVRHGAPFASAIVSTGFWIGITCGRILLGFVTPLLGEQRAIYMYLLCAIVLELLFWLVPNFVVSAVMVAFLGFFMGPLFCFPMVAAAKLVPKRLHVSAIGFGTAVGGGGGAVLPFLVGAIVNARGLNSFQPIILALLVIQVGLWLLLPKIPENAHED